MFVKRHIHLTDGDQLISSALIDGEDLEACLTAKNIRGMAKKKAVAIVEKAKKHAVDIIRHSRVEAREGIERERERAYREVWDCVNEHLCVWQREQEVMWAAIEEHAGRVLGMALENICLEVEQDERAQVLLRHMIASQKKPLKAVLRCPKEQAENISEAIECRGMGYWAVEPDASLAPDSLVLESPHGTFSISWEGLVKSLMD